MPDVCERLRPSPATSADPAIDISVCIANWNCLELLRDCLASLLHQEQGVSLEVIVVDNASTDGAAEMVETLFPDVQITRNANNLGFARANNQAARLARGRYLFFLNNDTVVPPQSLAGLLHYAERHPEAGLIAPRLCDPDGRTQISWRQRPTVATFLHRTALLRWTGLFRRAYRRYRREALASDVPRPVEVVMGAAMLIRRDRFLAIGGWDEDFTFGGEDFDLCARVGRRHPLIFLPGVTITHYGRTSTRRNLAYSAPQVMIGFARYLRKSGSSRLEMFVYKTVLLLDAPLQIVLKGAQALWRRLGGQEQKAQNSLQAVRWSWSFLSRGLVDFLKV